MLEREKERIHAEFAAPIWAGDGSSACSTSRPREGGFSEQQRHDLAAFGKAEGARFAAALRPEGHMTSELRALLADALAPAETSFGQLLKIEDDELVIVQTTGGEPVGHARAGRRARSAVGQ